MAVLTTLDVGQYSPALSIRAGVNYVAQTLVPDSGMYPVNNVFLTPNWSFANVVRYQNSRINGRYNIESNFEQGYFNFENWSGNKCYSTDWTKSGINLNVGGDGNPYLVDFWGYNDSLIGRTSLYNFKFNNAGVTSTPNISRAVVMSGVNGVNNSYDGMRAYIGTIPSGELTIYGRFANVNRNYEEEDVILFYQTRNTTTGGGGAGSTGYTICTTGANETSIGTEAWNTPTNVTTDDGFYSDISITFTTVNTNFILGTNYGFSLSDKAITQIKVKFDMGPIADVTVTENSIRLFLNGVPIGDNKSTGAALTGGVVEYTWSLGEFGSLSGADVSGATFGAAMSVHCVPSATPAMDVMPAMDAISIDISYEDEEVEEPPAVPALLGLINRGSDANRRLNWALYANGQLTYIELPGYIYEKNEFANFLLTYSSGTGIGNFYLAKDDSPLTLVNSVNLGNISAVFNGETKFVDESFNHGGTSLNNPKIITDYGVSNRLWTSTQINEFDQHRLNGAYWITEAPLSTAPSPSGSDVSSLRFHFPVKSSGNLGCCSSSGYRDLSYYVPLYSGINDRLYEFDRSQFNNTALSLDLWVENTGTNPSGNLGVRIDFCDVQEAFGRELLTMNSYWSGFPITIPTGLTQVRMSGVIFNKLGNLSDLSNISREQANHAGLYLGAWYNNIHREYYGDLSIYSARVNIDTWCTPASANNNITLYMSGAPITTSYIDLYINSSFASGDTTLFINGAGTSTDNITLYLEGGTKDAEMPLYIYSQPPGEMDGNIPLYMWATTNSGVANGITLFIGENAPSGVKEAGMGLFTMGPESAALTGSMPLYLRSETPSQAQPLTLYCYNAYTEATGVLTMFMRAPSGTLGAIPYSGTMNLFISRDSESIAGGADLYIEGPRSIDTSIPLSITGGTPYFSSIPLSIDGIGTLQNLVKFYINGY